MRILMIHNLYQIRGGEDESSAAEEKLLRSRGEIVEFYQETNDEERMKTFNSFQLASRTIWSGESYKIVRDKIRQHKIDVIHVQNFFPLISPSVYYAAQREGVPVVQSLRNYRLLCPNGLFFRQGQVCEDCLGQFIPYPGIVHACYRDNRLVTGVTTAMITTHRLLQTWHKQVNQFIALSQFARNKLIEAGLPEEKIVVKPNFVSPDPGQGQGKGGYALYVGRLSVEKGLDVLLEAWEKLAHPVPLKIVGEGPLKDWVVRATERFPHIEWLGKQPLTEVYKLMGEALFLVFPSKWYETFGRVAIEAFAKGTPVVASDIGAIAELVRDQVTGLKFRPGDGADLASQVDYAIAHPQLLQQMRNHARAEFLQKYTAEQNYEKLMTIYLNVVRRPAP
ncbi:glycosyltransferase [Spirulina subsalsa FACHB-351]|uniref:Glycosyltransferase n=1 Tax=Spirulina subsalsa FACHB-351 TaxID=234711 RepID=A0ABT3LBH5_9CYAN|nr:glycosyltransferase [Spirulina subsalsa]MCW6038846.1 glycosyltransferase [Spirulina subsalsa FACHB-351]